MTRLREHGQAFLITPYVRFAGQVGEQGTFFVRDPAGNALEFKTFRDPRRLFAVWPRLAETVPTAGRTLSSPGERRSAPPPS